MRYIFQLNHYSVAVAKLALNVVRISVRDLRVEQTSVNGEGEEEAYCVYLEHSSGLSIGSGKCFS